jgi:hypothetical protein
MGPIALKLLTAKQPSSVHYKSENFAPLLLFSEATGNYLYLHEDESILKSHQLRS